MKKQRLQIVYLILSAILLVAIVWLLVDASLAKKKPTGNIGTSPSVSSAQKQEKLFDAEKFSFAKEEVTVSTEVIEDGLKEMGVLITQEYFCTMVESYEKEVGQGIFTSKSRIVYSYDGRVNAGIDCSKLTVSKDEDSKTITVTIPKAYVKDVIIDLDSFKLYEEKQGLWSKIKMEDVNKSLIEYKNAAKENALEKDILAKADESAELIIDRFVKSFAEVSDYTVKYVSK